MTDTRDETRLTLLEQAYAQGLDVVRALRAAGVTAPIAKIGVDSVYSWTEVSGYFETSSRPFFRLSASPSGQTFEIYTIKDTKDISVTAPTVAEAVALAAQNPVLAAALGFGTIETGGEVYAVVPS